MNRLLGVMSVYLTRPLCWIICVIILPFLVFGGGLGGGLSERLNDYGQFGTHYASSGIFDSRRFVDSQDSLNEALKIQDGRPIVLRYGELVADLQFKNLKTTDAGGRVQEPVSAEQFFERLDRLEFPSHIQTLTTDRLKVRQWTIERIGNYSSLEHVEFLMPNADGAALDLSPFANLVKLKSLNVGQIVDFESLAPLQSLPDLETLTIGNHQFVTAQNMRDVAAIKSLKQLFLPDITRNPTAMAAMHELNSSSLEQIYVAIPPSETLKLQNIERAIPDLRVCSSLYLPIRAWSIFWAIMGSLMASFIGFHFLAMFTVNAAELTPGYRLTQRRVAWAVMLVLLLLFAGLMWICKVNLGLAVALSATALFAFTMLQTSLQTRTKPVSGMERWYGALFLVPLFVFIGWTVQNPLGLDSLLAQPPWWVVTALSLLAIFFAAKWNGALSSLCRDRIAVGNDSILSLFDMQKASVKLNSRLFEEQTEPFPQSSNWPVGVGLILLSIAFVLHYAPARWSLPPINSVLIIQLMVVYLIAPVIVLQKWWSRVPFFATMITRPPSRQSQIKQIFVGVAADCARMIPLLLAVTFLLGNQVADKLGSSAEVFIVACLLNVGVAGAFFALALLAITIRSTRWIIAFGIVVYIAFVSFGGSVAYIAFESRSWIAKIEPLIAVIALSILLLAATAGATTIMWRRYQKIEWGNFLR